MKRSILMMVVLAIGMLSFNTKTEPTEVVETSNIQIALLLDTSSSMDGLIEQAKSQLWKMVNELALSKRDGQSPNLEISLYEYGKSTLSASDGYIRQIVPLTTDLDQVSEELFQLQTNGGSEHCGEVIQRSLEQLEWTASNDDLKIIFIAGNEEFTQGPVDYTHSCTAAIERGIIVNTIHCGTYEHGVTGGWKNGADLADGKYMNIDHNDAVVHIDAPQDTRIQELNEELNQTYIGYGSLGEEKMELQTNQDSNARQYGASNAAERAVTKSSAFYNNASWDLVDAVEEDSEMLDELEPADLPEEMKDMEEEERTAYVKEKAADRAKIQQEIQSLSKERRDFIEKKRQEMPESSTLDNAMINTIKEQAAKKNYCFDEQ